MTAMRFLVIPPAGSGSKGDEGMMRGVISLLAGSEIIILNPQERCWLAEIADAGCSIREEQLDLAALRQYIKDGACLIVVGADVIDGSAGLAGSLERLDAMEVALKERGASYSFFSFRSDADSEIIDRLEILTSYERAHFFLRDEQSHSRFKEKFPNSNCGFFPDLAFFCDLDSFVYAGYPGYPDDFAVPSQGVVALNFSEQSFRAKRLAYSEESRRIYVKEICKQVIETFNSNAFLLVSNDIRNWLGFWSDYDYACLAKEIILELSPDAKVAVVDPLVGYQGIISILSKVRVLVTGRMHLSIAAIRSEKCIPVVVTGKTFSSAEDEKQRGMYDKARGMLQWAIGRPDFVVTDYQELGHVLAQVSQQYSEINQACHEHWVNQKSKIDSYRSSFRSNLLIEDKQIDLDPLIGFRNLNQSIKEQWFRAERNLFALRRELTERGEWAKGLERDLRLREQDLKLRDERITGLTAELVKRGEYALQLDSELQEERAKFAAIIRSKSWQLTAPLRDARRWGSALAGQLKCVMKSALRIAKRIYESLPLTAQTRATHRNLIARYAPKLLLATGTPSTVLPVSALSKRLELLNLPTDPSTGRVIVYSLPTSTEPVISIIIPVYGKVEYTLRCLGSIEANPPSVSFEVIVVDDCSPDDTAIVINNILGVKALKNPSNLGFVRSCNAGAKAAHGQYLLFLNNDTEVTPGWADELLRTFSEFPGTGLAGSKLVYPDGRLQEAGAIIWRDGNAWNFGRFQDPALPVYNYAREVDYCSGASIMVPASLFNELNGFDEHYVPAYCEDSDLALKIRDRGYRVIYQPLSMIVHFEGITSGTDTTQGAKAYQVENSKKLFLRWKDQLADHEVYGTDVDRAKDRTATRRVLVLDHCIPTPDQDAGSVSLYNIMMLLRDMNFQVTFIPEDNFLYDPVYTPALQRAGVEVLYSPWVRTVEQHLQEFGSRYDLIFLFRPTVVERNLSAVKKYSPQAKTLFYTHDLHHLRMVREAQLDDDAKKMRAAESMRLREFAAIEAVDLSILVSTAEFELLKAEIPSARLAVFPLILDIPGTTTTWGQRKDIVFVGGFQHTPNVNAMLYFSHDVMPHLRSLLPDVRLFIVGSKPPQEIQALQGGDITVTGFVEDLGPLLDKTRVSVAPLRFGAGIKGKIGTALAAGLPTVATSLAAEGMGLTDQENILIADQPESFAQAIARVYNDEQLWSHLSKAGVVFAEGAWGAKAAWQYLADLLDAVGLAPEPARYPLYLYSQKRTH